MRTNEEILDMALALACKELGNKCAERRDPDEFMKRAREAYALKDEKEGSVTERNGVFGYPTWTKLTKYGGGFVQTLAMLIPKADDENIERIRRGFPHEVGLFEKYMKEGV